MDVIEVEDRNHYWDFLLVLKTHKEKLLKIKKYNIIDFSYLT